MDTCRISSGDGEVEAVCHGEGVSPYVFLCHGFGSDKEGSHRERAEFLAENGFSAVRFDFRGNGGSTGEFAEQTLSSRVEDLVSVMAHFEPEEYGFFGSSFGAKVVYFSLEELRPNLVTVKSPALLDRVMDPYRIRVETSGTFAEPLSSSPVRELERRCSTIWIPTALVRLMSPSLSSCFREPATTMYLCSRPARRSGLLTPVSSTMRYRARDTVSPTPQNRK